MTIRKRTYRLLVAARCGDVEFVEDQIVQVTSVSNIVTRQAEKLIADGLLVRQGIKARPTEAGHQALHEYTA